MSDDEEMLPSPSHNPTGEDEEENGGFPASPSHDPAGDDGDDDDDGAGYTPQSPSHDLAGEENEEEDANDGTIPSPSQYQEEENADEEAAAAQGTATATAAGPVYDWYAYYDDEGRLYFYNARTEESAWDPPEEGFNPPPEQAEVVTTTKPAQQEQPEEATEATPVPGGEADEEAVATTTDGASGWASFQDDEGREYYYNAGTGETQWEKPEGFDDQVAAAADTQPAESSQEEDAFMDDADATEITAPIKDEPEEEEIDPEVLKLQQAKEGLEKPDSVMDRTCIAHVAEVAKSQGGKPDQALAKLVENYQGQTAVCGLLGRWLSRLRTATNKKSAGAENSGTSAAGADKIRESIQDMINRVAKERFSKEVGDKILNLEQEDASFIVDMIDSSRWRKLLIDLSASHKESAMLNFCLKIISQRGHHREIARRIDQSAHFSVFHQTVQSELTAVGKMAVSAGSDTSIGFPELVQDLERSCTKTSYTYLYSLEMLRALTASVNITQCSPRFRRAVRKWKVLSQMLEESMIDPASIGESSSPLFRKRRLDFALSLNELHQRQKKRQNTNGDGKSYEQHLQTLLRKHAEGIQVYDGLLDPLLPSGIDVVNATKEAGTLLIEHPLAIRALMGHLYKPGQTRVTNPVTRNKCARLIAFSVLAAEEKAKSESSALNGTAESDEVALTRTILEGAHLCEQLESMVSFLVVSASKSTVVAGQYPGQKLCGMAAECPAVAQGVMMWAKEFTRGAEFSASASFPTLSVCILSLVRVVATSQPFARKEAISIAVQFFGHSNPDISYQKVSAIKEQGLRILLVLLVKGEFVSVLETVTGITAKKGSSHLDASLIRYFVSGVVAVVKPPVSFIFARLFINLLKSPACVDSVRSKYFGDENRSRLTNLLKSFQALQTSLSDSMTKDDQALFSSSIALYQVD